MLPQIKNEPFTKMSDQNVQVDMNSLIGESKHLAKISTGHVCLTGTVTECSFDEHGLFSLSLEEVDTKMAILLLSKKTENKTNKFSLEISGIKFNDDFVLVYSSINPNKNDKSACRFDWLLTTTYDTTTCEPTNET